jgi:hypothetical protein
LFSFPASAGFFLGIYFLSEYISIKQYTYPENAMNRSQITPFNQSEYAGDVTSVDAIVLALYESVSFSPGSQPNYNRLRSLFHPDGRIIPPKNEQERGVTIFDVETFIKNSREYLIIAGLESKGFFEQESHRETDAFGTIVHIFSTYESRFIPKDPVPFQRGINSIQLIKEQGRWWVVTVLWDIERTGESLPSQYQ